jgi:hypothetical protein
MSPKELVAELEISAKQMWALMWKRLPDEERLRLSGLEAVLREMVRQLTEGLWHLAMEALDAEAEQEAGRCPCGRRRERRKLSIELDVLGLKVKVPCTYFYCRHCKSGLCPARRWLGKEDGGVSLALERALTDLTSRLTFGDAVTTFEEQHGQEVERTKAERVTYRVGNDALEYLEERGRRAFSELEVEARARGAPQLPMVADGGILRAGELERPAAEEVTEETERTPVRNLPKGTRRIQGREARLVVVREPDKRTERVVDLHIAPHNQPEVSGERMLAAAAEAGLRDNTAIHSVSDMGVWVVGQLEQQFVGYELSALADIIHVTEYLTRAGRVTVGTEGAEAYGQRLKRLLLEGKLGAVFAELEFHQCNGHCPTDEHGTCLARAAYRYLDNHRAYLDYPWALERDLAIGSGEAESGIRHLFKKRMDVAGAWKETNAQRVLALISIRASGWWDDFWRWRDARDLEHWRRRQRAEDSSGFRGRRTAPVVNQAT